MLYRNHKANKALRILALLLALICIFTIADPAVFQENLFDLVSGLLRTRHETVAEPVGISPAPRAGGEYQYFSP